MRTHLEGIRVLDLTAYLSGPFTGMYLAAMGAEVIKIEQPKVGDPCRWNPPFAGPEGVHYEMKSDIDVSLIYLKRNRNKKSIGLNLKSDAGKDIFKQLVAKSDVVLENFSPGVMERLGFDYETLREINPRIIFCSISGYGQDGPSRNRAAFDLTIQAASGLMDITGFPDGPPARCGAWIGDMTASLYAGWSISTALYSREKTGQGERIDIAMQDSCFSLIMDEALDLHLKMGIPMRAGNRNPRLAPWNVFSTKDGYIVVAVANNAQWASLLKALSREDLADDPRFSNPSLRCKHTDTVEVIVTEWVGQFTSEEALRRLREHKVPCDHVPGIAEVLEDENLHYRGMIHELVHPRAGKTGIKAAGFPVHFSECPATMDRSAPYPWQHTEEIYTEVLGMSQEELQALKDEGVV